MYAAVRMSSPRLCIRTVCIRFCTYTHQDYTCYCSDYKAITCSFYLRKASGSDGVCVCADVKPTSGCATWFTAGGAIRIAHYEVIDDVITRKL